MYTFHYIALHITLRCYNLANLANLTFFTAITFFVVSYFSWLCIAPQIII